MKINLYKVNKNQAVMKEVKIIILFKVDREKLVVKVGQWHLIGLKLLSRFRCKDAFCSIFLKRKYQGLFHKSKHQRELSLKLLLFLQTMIKCLS